MGELIFLPGEPRDLADPEEQTEQTLCFDDLRVNLAAQILRLSDKDTLVYAAHLKSFMAAVAATASDLMTPAL